MHGVQTFLVTGAMDSQLTHQIARLVVEVVLLVVVEVRLEEVVEALQLTD